MKSNEDIKKMENAGIEVTVVSNEGKIAYCTRECKKYNCCDKCPNLRILPDPDPEDWFNDDDVKAYCWLEKRTVEGAMRPYEVRNIEMPHWCPLAKEE